MKARASNLLPWIGIVAGAEIVVAAAAAWIRYLQGASLRLGQGYPDFLLYYATARLEAARGFARIYDQAAVLGFERQVTGTALAQALPLTSPPYVALAARPLALLDFKTAYTLWAVLSAAFIAAAILCLIRAAGLRGRVAWAFALLAAAWVPVLVAVLQAQVAGLVLLGAAAAALLWTRARQASAGAASIATLARPHLVLLLPILFAFRRRWPALVAVVAGGLVLFAVTLPFAGLGAWGDYLSTLAPGVLHGNQGFANAEQAPYSLRGLVDAIAGASLLDVVVPILLLVAVAAAVVLRPSRPPLDFALVTAASLDASLHQNLHDLTLLLVAVLPLGGLLLARAARFPVAGWAVLALTYLLVDAALFSPLATAAGLQLLVAYLLLERLAANRPGEVAGC